jgi:arylsulfatase
LHNGSFEKTHGYCTDVFFRQALSWMDLKRRSKAPFFACVTPNAPHAPLDVPPEYEARYKDLVSDRNAAKFFGMIANIDDNVGRVLKSLAAWGIERDTLFVFMTDNGGTAGVNIFNAGMRGGKNTPYQGGTRVPAFFRWPGTLQPATAPALSAHIDVFPTLAELASARQPAGLPLDGRSLLPLLRDPSAPPPDRLLFTHIGRWPNGQAAASKYAQCRVRNARFSMVNSGGGPDAWELYDLQADPGEKSNVAARHPDDVRFLNEAYDRWWSEILPRLENEDAVPPVEAPYTVLYRKQFGAAAPQPR